MRHLVSVLVLAWAASSSPSCLAGEADPMTRAERSDATRAFVLKWAPVVQQSQGIPMRNWALRMVPTFAKADPANFRRALQRDTLEGALAELSGRGGRLSDEQVIDAQAALGLPEFPKLQDMAIKTLGSTAGDLVYTAVTPCRLFDTRVVGGVVAGGATRSFLALAANAGVDFTSQGGSNTTCNVADVGASAVVVNVTAVTPSNNGFATVWKYGEVRPLAASFTFNAGGLVSNAVIVGVPNPLTLKDISLYSSSQAHYVGDIVGYFSPPQATTLDCVNTTVSTFSIAATTVNFFNNPACPTGYRATTPYCWTAASGVYSQGSGYNANSAGSVTFCAWQNTTGASQTVFGGNVCCRIPGR